MTPQNASEIARLRVRVAKLEAKAAEYKRTTQSLAASSAKTNSILEAAVDSIITIDESGTIESVNPATSVLFGYEPHELIGQNVNELMPPPFAGEHDAYLARYRATGVRQIIGIGREVQGRRRDGSIFPLELSVSEGFDGSRRFFTGMIHDVTDRKTAEDGLRESEERLRAILDSAVDGILAIDERGIIEDLNPAALKLFGYREDELLGQNVEILMPSPYREDHAGYLSNYLTTGEKKIIGIDREVIGLRRNGTTFPMRLTVSEGLTKHRRIFTGIVRDLSERNDARQSEAGLAAIVEESLNEIFVFDADSLRFIEVNRGARENLGYSLAELQEMTPVDLKPDFDTDAFQQLVAPLRSGAKNRLQFEAIHERKDGSRYPVDVHLQLGSYGGEVAFLALIFDMTERIEAREALEDAEERARQAEALASVATLTAGLAHDIGTPMGVILGYANMLEKSLVDEKQRMRARIIGEQSARVTDLIQTLLNISRPHEPKRASLQIAEIIDHSLQFYQEKLKSHEIEVERDLDRVANILGDRDQLEQVFLNLFVNAADAMPSGGTLTVRIRALTIDFVEVRVADTGIGISAAEVNRIFDPFFTTKERGKGNGLGLLVSRRIIREHGGSIGVTSTLGEGTEFRITLPFANSPEPELHD